MSSKVKFEDSYEMRLNEFKLSLLCFSLSHEAVFLAAVNAAVLGVTGKCLFL